MDIGITVLGGLLLVSGAVTRALVDDEVREAAETAGYIVGGVFGTLLLVLLVRFAYVRLFAKQASVWSPWVLVVAGAIEWLAAAGAAGDG